MTNPASKLQPHGVLTWGGCIRLVAAVGFIYIMMAWMAPALSAWLNLPVHAFIQENDIKTNAWFYTDSDLFAQSTAALQDELLYHPR